MANFKSVHVRITGIVQGVFYRVSTQQKAIELGLSGWVTNCDDGSVEALFEGPYSQIQTMIQWCFQGPTNSIVDNVVILDSKDCTNLQEGFNIRYD